MIKVGGVNKQELLRKIYDSSIGMNDYAHTLFKDEKFTITPVVTEINVIETSVSDLGYKDGALYSEIMDSALEKGFELCTLELAPHLRLQYTTQDDGPYLTVASNKTRNDETYPNGFYLRNNDDFLWLRGYRATSDWIWDSNSRFAFIAGGA